MNNFNKKIFAQNLQYYMDKKGIDRNQLCADVGFGYSTVSEWLNANKYPRIDKIEKLSDYFGIPKSYLIEEHKIESTPADKRRSALIKKVEQIPDSEIARAEAVLSAMFDDIDK